MITATMELATIRALESVERVRRHATAESWLTRLAIRPMASMFDWVFARAMRSHAEKLSDTVLLLRSLVQFDGDEQVDADLHLRGTLDQVMEKVERMRGSVTDLLTKSDSVGLDRFAVECRRFIAVSNELRSAVLHLQWEMAEHDANMAAHRDDFVASDADSLGDMLDRISAS